MAKFKVIFTDGDGENRVFPLKAKRYQDCRKEALGVYRQKLNDSFYAKKVSLVSEVDDLTQFIRDES